MMTKIVASGLDATSSSYYVISEMVKQSVIEVLHVMLLVKRFILELIFLYVEVHARRG